MRKIQLHRVKSKIWEVSWFGLGTSWRIQMIERYRIKEKRCRGNLLEAEVIKVRLCIAPKSYIGAGNFGTWKYICGCWFRSPYRIWLEASTTYTAINFCSNSLCLLDHDSLYFVTLFIVLLPVLFKDLYCTLSKCIESCFWYCLIFIVDMSVLFILLVMPIPFNFKYTYTSLFGMSFRRCFV